MNKNKEIGFIYRIDYIGSNPIIQGLSYAGSKLHSSKIKWEKYFGSPTKKNCIKCKTWKVESIKNPQDFNKQIIEYVYEGESITQKEAEYMKSVCDDIINNDKWLNTAIPKLKGFPECIFSKKERLDIFKKRQKTNLEKYGNIYGNFTNIEKRINTCLKKYGVTHVNKLESRKIKNSEHKKNFFSSMSPEEKKLHGEKIKNGQNKNNLKEGLKKSLITRSLFPEEKKKEIQNKRKEKWKNAVNNRSKEKQEKLNKIYSESSYLYNKFRYITIKYLETGKIESKFMSDWKKEGFGEDGIRDRIKNNSFKPLWSKTKKVWIVVLKCIFISRYEVFHNPELYC